jgi:hypothetical protein
MCQKTVQKEHITTHLVIYKKFSKQKSQRSKPLNILLASHYLTWKLDSAKYFILNHNSQDINMYN